MTKLEMQPIAKTSDDDYTWCELEEHPSVSANTLLQENAYYNLWYFPVSHYKRPSNEV